MADNFKSGQDVDGQQGILQHCRTALLILRISYTRRGLGMGIDTVDVGAL